jgi:hypothetical protein
MLRHWNILSENPVASTQIIKLMSQKRMDALVFHSVNLQEAMTCKRNNQHHCPTTKQHTQKGSSRHWMSFFQWKSKQKHHIVI